MIEPFRNILCPVYFDETSPVALDYARHLARRTGGTVQLLHVVPTDEFHLLRQVYRPEEGGGADPAWAERVATERLEALAHEYLAGIDAHIVTRYSADPATGILEAERELGADLIVLATHRRTGLAHLIWGSVAEKVLRESLRPVFITHQSDVLADTVPFQRILVPIDIAERSVAALLYARQLAEQFQGTVYPLHIVPSDETAFIFRDVYQAEENTRANVVVAEKIARRKLAELAREHLPPARYETILHVSDHPAKIILEVEKEIRADVLIMATHGFTGLFHLLLGSLTEKMVREAACPVLSIRQRLDGPPRPPVRQERGAA